MIFRHARPTGQVIFSVSIAINYKQKFAKDTFKHWRYTQSDPNLYYIQAYQQSNNKQSLQSLVVSVYVIYGSLAVPKWPVASSNYLII